MRSLLRFSLPFAIVLAAACGSERLNSGTASNSGGTKANFGDGSGGGSGGGAGAGSGADAYAPTSSNSGGGTTTTTSLTAGVWDDNANYSLFAGYRDSVISSGKPTLTAQEQETARDEALVAPTAKTTLDVALVLDATGSMGDEMSYLKSELASISQSINAQFPNAQQRWALVMYRDDGDQYVVKTSAFTTDVNAFSQDLAQQQASGGGDFPEAPDQALAAAAQLSWRSTDTAKIAFWVADAPHHDQYATRMADSYRSLKAAGVKIYPVASSGIDEFTEYTMRAAAQLTGGRYLFLTNDSGLGGDHKEPSIPCYQVTTLSNAMIRVVQSELTGTHVSPDASTVIREVGSPANGSCQLSDGGTATLF